MLYLIDGNKVEIHEKCLAFTKMRSLIKVLIGAH